MIDKGANKMEHITREAAYHDTCSNAATEDTINEEMAAEQA